MPCTLYTFPVADTSVLLSGTDIHLVSCVQRIIQLYTTCILLKKVYILYSTSCAQFSSMDKNICIVVTGLDLISVSCCLEKMEYLYLVAWDE